MKKLELEIEDIIKKYSLLTPDELLEQKRLSHQRQDLIVQGKEFNNATQLQIREEMLLQEVISLWVSVLNSDDEESAGRIASLQQWINKKKQEQSRERVKAD